MSKCDQMGESWQPRTNIRAAVRISQTLDRCQNFETALNVPRQMEIYGSAMKLSAKKAPTVSMALKKLHFQIRNIQFRDCKHINYDMDS